MARDDDAFSSEKLAALSQQYGLEVNYRPEPPKPRRNVHQERKRITEELQYELARRDFWYYCTLVAPDFYVEGRTYLEDLCRQLQEFNESDEDVLVINCPPRHGKSRTAQLFVQWLLGNNPSEKIMTGSYNEQLSTTFSRGVRNAISERKVKGGKTVFADIFPSIKVKKGDGAASLWALEGQHASYLATSPGGTATGFGCTRLIIDDLVKNAEEAFNEDVLEKQWQWFTQTMLSRREANAKIIIIMTRWSTKDLAGRALSYYGSIEGAKVRHINYKALQDDDTMLCEEILSRRDFELNKEAMGADVVAANYQQEPLDSQGRLYSGFLTYSSVPTDENGICLFERINAYVDTADKGNDYLAAIIYGIYNNQAYVLDIYFTKDNMEITEPELARKLYAFNVSLAYIESNNGGRGFGRSVERILREHHHWYKTSIDLFYQNKNKKARILGAATWVQKNVLFPVGWEFKWAEAYKDLASYTKEGKMKHDDIEDALSGIYDKMGRGSVFSWD